MEPGEVRQSGFTRVTCQSFTLHKQLLVAQLRHRARRSSLMFSSLPDLANFSRTPTSTQIARSTSPPSWQTNHRPLSAQSKQANDNLETANKEADCQQNSNEPNLGRLDRRRAYFSRACW